MPDKQIEQIIDKVRKREHVLEPLYERMDEDYLLWKLAPFKPRQGEGISQNDAFTDNQPRVDSDKIVNFIASAERVIRVENDNELKDQRDANNNAERVAIGMLREADRRLERAGKPVLQSALGWQSTVRGGWISARALLLKNPDGSTKVDVWPLDPRQTVMVANADGPLWAANITQRSRAEIRGEYPKFRFKDEDSSSPDEDADNQERVIDYYDKVTLKDGSVRYMNRVIVDEQYAKKPANTFAETFPIIFRLVGSNPGVSPFSILNDGMGSTDIAGVRDIGESFFAPNRHIYKLNNRAQSYRLSLMGRAVQGIKKVYSSDGTKELDGDVDENGSEVQLSVQNQEEVKLLEVAQLTRDADVFAAYTAAAGAKGGLTGLAHGELPAPVSGRALTVLRSAIGEKLNPYLQAVESCINGIVEALLMQYATGHYRAIKVAGRTRNRMNFSREIQPEDIEDHGPTVVRLRAQLPEDAIEKWQMAQIASTPNAITQESLASSQFIRDEILDMQDGDYETSRQYAMKARMSTPVMLLTTQYQAAIEQEDWETAEFLSVQIQRLLEGQEMEHMARMFAFMQQFGVNPMAAAGGGMNGGGGGNGAGGGRGFGGGENGQGTQRNPAGNLRPEVAPQSGTPFGQPNPANAGRPASRDEEDQRLAALGLERG